MRNNQFALAFSLHAIFSSFSTSFRFWLYLARKAFHLTNKFPDFSLTLIISTNFRLFKNFPNFSPTLKNFRFPLTYSNLAPHKTTSPNYVSKKILIYDSHSIDKALKKVEIE